MPFNNTYSLNKIVCCQIYNCCEFITPQDGSAKQDCELNAAERWIERNSSLSARKIIITGDDLFSGDPFCMLLLTHGFHFILICSPSSHTTLYQHAAAPEQTDDITIISHRKWNGQFHELHTCRYVDNLPLKQGDDALSVNWAELTVINTRTQEVLYKNSWLMLVFGVLFDKQMKQRMKQSFATFAGIMNKIEKTRI